MTIAGNIYGVVLNDQAELNARAAAFQEKPYGAPPRAPVVYMKPLASVATGPIAIPTTTGLCAASTLAILIARDTGGVDAENIGSCIGGLALALDFSVPTDSYYRPAIEQKNGLGRLALGTFVHKPVPKDICLRADGHIIHTWPLSRLARPVAQLIVDLGSFLTLKAGDVLLTGLAGDAPIITAAHQLHVEAEGLPALHINTIGEAA